MRGLLRAAEVDEAVVDEEGLGLVGEPKMDWSASMLRDWRLSQGRLLKVGSFSSIPLECDQSRGCLGVVRDEKVCWWRLSSGWIVSIMTERLVMAAETGAT